MSTLNPDLISKDMDAVLNDAVPMLGEYRKSSIMPEMVLLALLRRENTAAWRMFKMFESSRGVDLERLERQVTVAIQSRRDPDGSLDFVAIGNKKVSLSRQSIVLLDDGLTIANSMNEQKIDTDHALAVLAETSVSTGGILRQFSITPKSIQDAYSDASKIIPSRDDSTTVDYVKRAKRGLLRAVHFREDLLRNMINVLTQSVNRHIILIGPDGVGKRTLAYSLALLMAEDKGPNGLSNLVQISETALLDGDQEAFRAGMSAARRGVLFLPLIHRFFGGPIKADFNKATSLVQKAFLSEDPVVICTTNVQEFEARIQNVSAIMENSQIIRVDEPSLDETVHILETIAPHLESDYEIAIEHDALKMAARMAQRYLTINPLPQSAEQLLHRTAAMVNMGKQAHLAFRPDNNDAKLDVEDVTLVTSQMTGIPVTKLGADERLRYANMVERLRQRLIGQEEAVQLVSRAIKTARVGLKDPRRPIGVFLFLGPTGIGKTEMARVLADFMFGSEENLFPLDMSEYKDESSINRLIGSAVGYVGSDEGGQLTERIRQQPYTIVLLDEIEKAHPRIMDVLLQVMEEGRLTDGRGNIARFSEAVVIMTSNIGSEHLMVRQITDDLRERIMEQVLEFLRPEFVNRLDEVILFNALSDEDFVLILDLLIEKENKLARERGLTLKFSDGAKKWLLDQNDEPEYGARPLRRVLRRNLREPLADFLLRSNPPEGTEVRISASRKRGGGLKFSAYVDGEEFQG
ncbi:MAG: ATP-dependent Clp protease ATP-binding subunit [Chloroflexota bacterium]|nr:ATP-dependent Clp protease ATP-binding subunit [Chloroflexota bacterium]